MDLPPQQQFPEPLPQAQALIPDLAPEVKSVDLDQRINEYLEHRGYEPASIDVSITKKFESPAEMLFRQQQAIGERLHQQRKEYLNYGLGTILVIILVTVSMILMFSPKATADTQAWARTTLTSMATAVVGYVFGTKNSEKK
jgi:cation transport ATPase